MAKGQRFCIFCEGSSLSGEHIYSEWLHPYLPPSKNDIESRFSLHVNESGMRQIKRVRSVKKNQKLKDRKAPVVCKTCNSGWMSQCETQSRNALLHLVLSEEGELDADDRYLISTWVTMKHMVIDALARPNNYFSKEDCLSFYRDRIIPERFSIWVGRISPETGWSTRYDRYGLPIYKMTNWTLSVNHITSISEYEFKIQAIIQGIGLALFFSVYDRTPGLPPLHVDEFKDYGSCLWPSNNERLAWPPIKTLNRDNIEYLYRKTANHTLKYLNFGPIRRRDFLKALLPDILNKTQIMSNHLADGGEFHDVCCGNCKCIIFKGYSIWSLKELVQPTGQRIAVQCRFCDALNEIFPTATSRK